MLKKGGMLPICEKPIFFGNHPNSVLVASDCVPRQELRCGGVSFFEVVFQIGAQDPGLPESKRRDLVCPPYTSTHMHVYVKSCRWF